MKTVVKYQVRTGVIKTLKNNSTAVTRASYNKITVWIMFTSKSYCVIVWTL